MNVEWKEFKTIEFPDERSKVAMQGWSRAVVRNNFYIRVKLKSSNCRGRTVASMRSPVSLLFVIFSRLGRHFYPALLLPTSSMRYRVKDTGTGRIEPDRLRPDLPRSNCWRKLRPDVESATKERKSDRQRLESFPGIIVCLISVLSKAIIRAITVCRSVWYEWPDSWLARRYQRS